MSSVSSAFCIAVTASPDSVSPGCSKWRAPLPVRFEIHSSFVSTSSSSMLLLTRVSGAHEPTPTSRDRSADFPAAALAVMRSGLRAEQTEPTRRELARPLPVAHRTQSRLVCPLSGVLLGADHPPVALPNGSVYARDALQGTQDKAGHVVCPRTGDCFPMLFSSPSIRSEAVHFVTRGVGCIIHHTSFII